MVKKLKIYSLPNREVKYVRLQIESFKRHMDFENIEFTIVNGSIDHRDEINKICQEEGIEVHQYYGNPNSTYLEYGSNQQRWFIDNIVRNSTDYILLMHPDMFFIDKLDHKKIIGDKKIIFVPRYTIDFFYMWEGIILLDAEFFNTSGKIDYLDTVGFKKGPHGWSDGGGASSDLLEKMEATDYGFFEFWNLHDFDGDSFTTNLNGHASYKFNLSDRTIVSNSTGIKGPLLGNKTFPYEVENPNYDNYYIDNFVWIRDNFVSGYPFPKPTHIDIICSAGKLQEPFVIHFKSGSGYQDFFNKNYQEQKLIALEQVINNWTRSV